jgi:hypothetical protein
VLNNSIKVSVKKKPKAAVGDRYDVILTYGGDRKIEGRESSKRSCGPVLRFCWGSSARYLANS